MNRVIWRNGTPPRDINYIAMDVYGEGRRAGNNLSDTMHAGDRTACYAIESRRGRVTLRVLHQAGQDLIIGWTVV